MGNLEKIARGERIRTIRLKLDLNQKDFGEKLHLKTSTISGYESGEADPKPDTLVQIAAIGGVTIDWLITGQETLKKQAEIAATVEPGTEEKKARLRVARERNILLRKVVEWMDETFTNNDEQALFFYEDLKERYPSFAEFVDKNRPGREKRETAASA